MFQARVMPVKSRNCQSCGMPLSRALKREGSEADGSRSALYCNRCYENGQFTLPDLTAEDMQQRVKAIMKEMEIPGLIAWFFTSSIPRLHRWKQ